MRQTRAIFPDPREFRWHSWHKTRILVSLACVLGAGTTACGGTSEASSDPGRESSAEVTSTSSTAAGSTSSGSSVGGAMSTGTGAESGSNESGSGVSSSTSAGGATTDSGSQTTGVAGFSGGPVCCNALPGCPPDWVDVGIEGCPDGVECMTVELCCDSVTCMPDPGINCDAYPVCNEGDVQVSECPADATCYSQSLCGTTITCREAECFPDDYPQRDYLGLGDVCQLLDFVCIGESTAFFDECGCGCEQDEACPEFVDCEPGGDLDPLCSDTETCPLSERAE